MLYSIFHIPYSLPTGRQAYSLFLLRAKITQQSLKLMLKVRFPPSPTGPMHIGTARAMLFNFLFARSQGGKIVFRSEDTDRERSKPEFEQEILAGLKWLGLEFDEGPYRQSERHAIYEKHFEKLKASGKIYPCFCTSEELEAEREMQQQKKLPPRYSRKCCELKLEDIAQLEAAGKKPVWRFRVEDKEIHFTDLVRGEIKELGKNISDFVIRKADGQFLYHFTVVVDDIDMDITHVIRGEDHIANTSKHIMLFEALGAKVPTFAHLPLLLNKDRSKMSKRDESGRPATLKRLEEDGYLPEAVVNFLALLGWNPGDEREFFTLGELVKEFKIEKVHKAGAVFDLERLDYCNSHYIKQLTAEDLAEKIKPFLDFEVSDEAKLIAAVKLIQARLKNLAEAPAQLKFFFTEIDYAVDLFPHEKMQVGLGEAKNALVAASAALADLEDWSEAAIQAALMEKVTQLGIKNGQLLWPIRVALTGEKFSPGVWEVAVVLGKTETLKRLQQGIDKL
jgi:glutamyl-tRNA synthetase